MMLDKYITYTNLLMMYVKETAPEKKEAIRYELLLLEEGFKPVWRKN